MPGQFREFLSHISRYGVAKTSHFTFSCPVLIPGDQFSDIQETLSLRCEAGELPGRQLVSGDSRTYGPTYKTPYQSVYQEITLNFIETSNFIIRAFFETWMNNIFNAETNKLEYPDKTGFECSLTQYDVMLNTDLAREEQFSESSLQFIARWQLHNARPTAVNQMPVSWSEDGLHRTTVTLAFEWYSLSTTATVVPPATALNKSAPVFPKGSSSTGILGLLKF